MNFKNIKFPIRTKKESNPLSYKEYIERTEWGTEVLSKKRLERSSLDPHSCTKEEKKELKKSRGIYYFSMSLGKTPICPYCHLRLVVSKEDSASEHPCRPLFCPKCDSAIRNSKCVYCGKDISHLPATYIFCRECLKFVDAKALKEKYKKKKKEVRKHGYVPPEEFEQLCLEEECQSRIDNETNPYFCKKHWKEYKQNGRKPKDSNINFSRSKEEREKIRKKNRENTSPTWIWENYFDPALELIREENYELAQEKLINFLSSHENIPKKPRRIAHQILGDVCFFDKDYERAVGYYKQNRKWNLDKVLNARRLSGESMAGDEIIKASQKSFHVDKFKQEENDDPLAGYTDSYRPTGFLKNNRGLVEKFAEKLANEWEQNNNKKLLSLGGEMSYYIWGTPWISYLLITNRDKREENWYKKKLLNKSYSYHYCPQREFVEVVVQIVYKAEDMARQSMGIPKRGEGWASETELYYKVDKILDNLEVIHHGHPDWLRPQHLDIWIPKIKLAIEYMGRQHYEPVDFFGGEEGYEEIKENDKRKKRLCRKAGVNLIYFKYNENLSTEGVKEKVQKSIEN